jgi:hypothetical protein
MKSSHVSILLAMIFVLAACAPVSNTEENQPQTNPTENLQTVVLTWERTGGIAGFCDKVIIYDTSLADVINCKGDIQTRIHLTEGQRLQLGDWLKTLKPVEFTQTDPAVTDAMTIALFLAGEGSQTANEEIISSISEFAADIATQAEFDGNAPPDKDEAEQALREYLSALNKGDFILGAKLYGGSVELLQIWNPDITDDLPALLERACTQNGLVCMNPSSIEYRGKDEYGTNLFRVEFSNPDGTLFQQGPCCGDEEGITVTNFIFRVIKTDSGYTVLDLPPYVP